MMRNRGGGGLLGPAPGRPAMNQRPMPQSSMAPGVVGGEGLLGHSPANVRRPAVSGGQSRSLLGQAPPTSRPQHGQVHHPSAAAGYIQQPGLLEEPAYYEQQQEALLLEPDQYVEDAYADPYAEQQYVDDPYAVEAYAEEEQYTDQVVYPEETYAEPAVYEEPYVETEVYPTDQEFYAEEDQLDAESLMEYAEQLHGRGNRSQGLNTPQNAGYSAQQERRGNAGANRNPETSLLGQQSQRGFTQSTARQPAQGRQQSMKQQHQPTSRQQASSSGAGLLGEHPDANRHPQQTKQQPQRQERPQQQQRPDHSQQQQRPDCSQQQQQRPDRSQQQQQLPDRSQPQQRPDRSQQKQQRPDRSQPQQRPDRSQQQQQRPGHSQPQQCPDRSQQQQRPNHSQQQRPDRSQQQQRLDRSQQQQRQDRSQQQNAQQQRREEEKRQQQLQHEQQLQQQRQLEQQQQLQQQQLLQQQQEQLLQQQQHQMRGLLDTPMHSQAASMASMANQMAMGHMVQAPMNPQLELMTKAQIQMQLIEQEKFREMEEMTLLQQQEALLMQQEQQKLMNQAQEMMGRRPQQPQGRQTANIPSLFDLPTPNIGRGGNLGKRPGATNRPMDNKRSRPAGDRSRERDNQSNNRRLSGGNQRSSSRDTDRERKSRFEPRDSSSNTGRRLDSSPRRSRDRKDSGQGRDNKGAKSASRDGRRSRDSGRGTSSSREKSATGSKPGDKADRKSDVKESGIKKDGVSGGMNPDSKDLKVEDKASGSDKKDGEELKGEVAVTLTEEYDPANPTGDIDHANAVKSEAMETDQSKPASEGKDTQKEEKKEEDNKPQEISLTVTVNKKGRSVNDADKPSAGKPKPYKCNVCSVDCYDEESFARHMNGMKHQTKMKALMLTSNHQASIITARMQAEEHLRQIEAKQKKPEQVCSVCEHTYTGHYENHRNSKEHKTRLSRMQEGCKLCKVESFKTFPEMSEHLRSSSHYKKVKQEDWPECKLCKQRFKSPRKFVQHCKSEKHAENKRALSRSESGGKADEDDLGDLVTLDTVGFEDDSAAGEGDKKSKSGAPDGKKSPDKSAGKTDTGVKPAVVKRAASEESKMDDGDLEIPDVYDPSLTVGQKFVVPVSGYFCKLCHKYYNNENAARVLHCQSQSHFTKLQALVARTKKLKEEQEKASANEKQQSTESSQSEASKEDVGGAKVNGEQSETEKKEEDKKDSSDSTQNNTEMKQESENQPMDISDIGSQSETGNDITTGTQPESADNTATESQLEVDDKTEALLLEDTEEDTTGSQLEGETIDKSDVADAEMEDNSIDAQSEELSPKKRVAGKSKRGSALRAPRARRGKR